MMVFDVWCNYQPYLVSVVLDASKTREPYLLERELRGGTLNLSFWKKKDSYQMIFMFFCSVYKRQQLSINLKSAQERCDNFEIQINPLLVY